MQSWIEQLAPKIFRGTSWSFQTLHPLPTSVSGLAVTASLIYVGIQTKQNVRHTRALIHQGTAARTTNILLGFMNVEIVTAWIKGNGGTATPELIRQWQLVRSSLRHFDDCNGRLLQPA